MNPRDTEHVLDEISREQLPSDLNLMPGIAAKIQQGKRTMNPALKLRFIAPLLLVALLLIALLSLPGVASAVRGLFGYIPGVGPVDQSAPLRVLAEPVTSERDGYILTIESAVLDSSRTVLNYRLSGQFPSWDDPMLRPTMCQESPSLRLPDGTMLSYPSRAGSGYPGGDVTWQDIYPAVPANVDSAVLVLPCLSDLPAGEGPINWEIPLAFAPAPPNMTVFPVVQPVTPEPTAPPTAVPLVETTPAETVSQETVSAPSPDGWQWTLEGMATLDEGYYLETLLRWEADPSFYEVEIYGEALHLFDANGQELSVWLADPAAMTMAEAGSLALNLQTQPITAPGPARLVIDYVTVHSSPFVSFTIDVGSDPQPGQVWQVNKDVEIDGRTLRVVSAEYVQAGPNEPAMLMLYLESDSGILTVIAWDKDHETMFAGGSPATAERPFRSGLHYPNGIPEGTLNIEITSMSVRRDGPWTLTWSPPAVEGTQASAAPRTPGICQDVEPVTVTADALPAGLGGRVAFVEGEQFTLFVSNLDGIERIELGPGLMPQLSPDGSRVVYHGRENGLYIRDVDGAESTPISGTEQEEVFSYMPLWSPDGKQIAYNHSVNHQQDIMIVNADGTDPRSILSGQANGTLLGWSPDGRQIIFWLSDDDSVNVWIIDLASGESREVATLPLALDGWQINLSPDATRIAYENKSGIFLYRLDGSDPVLLHSNADLFISPVWSPDSQWIMLAYLDGTNNSIPAHVLLNPNTCQMLRIEAPLGNSVSSWVGE